MRPLDPGLGLGRLRLDHEDGVARADARLRRAAEGVASSPASASQSWSGSPEKSVSLLEPAGRGRGRPRRRRCPARGRSSARASRRGARRGAPRSRSTSRTARRSRTYVLNLHTFSVKSHGLDDLARHMEFPTYLEAGQVLLDLPGRDLLVVAVPLVALHADEVVDVVLVAAAAERLRGGRRPARAPRSRRAGSPAASRGPRPVSSS